MLIAGIKLFLNPVFVHLHKDAVECHLKKSPFSSVLQMIFSPLQSMESHINLSHIFNTYITHIIYELNLYQIILNRDVKSFKV